MNSLREHLSLPAEPLIKCMNENMCVFVKVHVPYEEIWPMVKVNMTYKSYSERFQREFEFKGYSPSTIRKFVFCKL